MPDCEGCGLETPEADLLAVPREPTHPWQTSRTWRLCPACRAEPGMREELDPGERRMVQHAPLPPLNPQPKAKE